MAKPRYSEAERRGRNSNQDVTNIGVAGRRTGLRVEGARRGSDGFENQSAYFSPTTTAKKANNKRIYSSPRSVKSATKNPSGSIEDMELEASESTSSDAALTTGSAADVNAVLRRRSEGPIIRRSQLTRRSLSPTKTHLNSPALRVRSAKKAATSPPKSALKSAQRAIDPTSAVKIARKLDFTRPDFDEEETPRRTRHSGSALVKPMPASAQASASRKRKLVDTEPIDQDDSDEMTSPRFKARAQTDFEDIQQPTFQADDVNDQLDAPFEDYIEEPEVTPPPISPRKSKKSPKSATKSQNKHIEPEPEQQDEPPMEFDQEMDSQANALPQEEEPPKKKRGRPKKADKPDTKKARPTSHASLSPSRASRERSTRTASPQREWREPVNLDNTKDDQDDGVRKSSRFKIAPLAFWRGEKMVYGRGSRRKSAGGTMGLTLPEVKEIIHVDIIEGEKRRKLGAGRRKKTPRRTESPDSSSSENDADNWEDKVIVEAPVRSFENQSMLTKKTLAVPESAYDPRPVHGQEIFFQKTLSEEPHFAAGVLDIPSGAGKPVKPSKQNTMFFFIFTGYVQVKIHDVVFRLRKGGQFTVPRGNFYEILNVGKKNARLFFSQSTDTLANHLLAHPEIMA